MRGLWAVALAVAAMFVSFGTARAQFVGIPKPASIIVTVTKSDQHMIVTVDGKPHFKWSVSTGARGYATPSGRYKVRTRRASQIETVQRRADALCDFLR